MLYRSTVDHVERMMTSDKITAVLFDWDCTLARTLGDISFGERLAVLFQSNGLTYTRDEILTALQRHQNDVRQGKLRGTIKPQTRQDILYFYRHILTRLGHPDTSMDLADRLYNGYAQLPTFLYDDTMSTLRALKQRGLTLGIISNHASTARKVMQQQVGQYIPPDHIFISQDLGVHKPAKTIFRHALTRIRITTPRNCLFVGDNLKVDAIGSVVQGGFGMGLWLDRRQTGANQTLPSRVARITSLQQVLDFI